MYAQLLVASLISLTFALTFSFSRPLDVSVFVPELHNAVRSLVVSIVNPNPHDHSSDLIILSSFSNGVYNGFYILRNVLISSYSFPYSINSLCPVYDSRFALDCAVFPGNSPDIVSFTASFSSVSSTDLILLAFEFSSTSISSSTFNTLSIKIFSFLNYNCDKSFDSITENNMITINISPIQITQNNKFSAEIDLKLNSETCTPQFPHILIFYSKISYSFCINSNGRVNSDPLTWKMIATRIPFGFSHVFYSSFLYNLNPFLLILSKQEFTVYDKFNQKILRNDLSFDTINLKSFIVLDTSVPSFLALFCSSLNCKLRLFTLSFNPSDLVPLSWVVSVSAGGTHSLAVLADGTVISWGDNSNGAQGYHGTTARTTPGPVYDIFTATSATAGTKFSIVLRNNFQFSSFGHNSNGFLGDGTDIDRPLPVHPQYPQNFVQISAGTAHCIGMQADGTVFTWGSNGNGRLGLGGGSGFRRLSPSHVSDVSNVVSVSAGHTHTLIALSNGNVMACGQAMYSRLGSGHTSDRSSFVPTSRITNGRDVAAGGHHSLVLTSEGSVYSFGYNPRGQLGLGHLVQQDVPEIIPNLFNVVAVSAGDEFSIVLLANGDVYTFGQNTYKELGDGGSNHRSTPFKLPTLSNIVAISAGTRHLLVLAANSTVYAWGTNDFGQLGDSTMVSKNYPVEVKI
ncbi:hypothetical protein RCL1_005029 [Eukaryota sp. TZLM3-RCL]